MSTIMRALKRFRDEKGQAIILFVGVFTIIAAIGAITIDFGIWYSERRGAQTDSDLIALSGAFELLDSSAGFAEVDVATQQSSLENDVDPVEDLQNLEVKALAFPDGFENDSEYCHTAADTGDRLNAVVLDVSHDSRALFADMFGIAAPDIGAHACARAGSIISTTGLRPWAVSISASDCFTDGVPQFGEDCIFRADDASATIGSINLSNEEGAECGAIGGGTPLYKQNIVNGAAAVCSIGDMISVTPGLRGGPTLNAIRDMIALEGECDALNDPTPDTIDQFEDSFQSTTGVVGPDETFVARDCVTPRAVSIVMFEDFEGSGACCPQPIAGFAAFFLVACEVIDNDGVVIRVDEKCDLSQSETANFQIRGFFMNVLVLEGDIGDFNDFGTTVIRLAE